MNKSAYELADELENLYQQDCIDGVADLSMPESANTLRQQADRIAKLESCDKPVCWIREDGVVAFHEKPHLDSKNFKWFPLYTTLSEQVSWKDIENYEEFYEVSSNGDIRNKNTGKILAKSFMGAGYVKADLWKDNKRWQTSVHRIVAQAFIENINEHEEVNHINGIKTDNRAENLEWVTRSENCNHSLYELGNRIKEVFAINLKTGETRKYPSVASVEKDGFEPKNVSEVCRMKNRYTHKGWSFKFIEDSTPQTKPRLSDEEIISEWIGNDRNYYNFARAIQKRILGK